MNKVNIEEWDRSSVFQFFSGFEEQLYSIDFEIKLPENFKKECRANGLTPFFTILFNCTKILNNIDNFRYRLVDNDVYLFDQINPIWVDIDKNKQLKIMTCEFSNELAVFKNNIKNRSEIHIDQIKENPGHFTVSNNHWFDWKSVKHTRISKNETNQKLVWGDIQDSKVQFSMEVSHLFVDAYHFSLFKKELEESLFKIKAHPL